ncbi:hypothetical protein [Paenibacillus xylanexedens]|uniref:hypothetical protein n=1 Tax=Paenibacillus xylanexedens TaxID=528191 RepID=UPI000F52F3AB|nr:hypothetical protein [Paenibacillus xylanexedens]RPK27810.1 hypothetical protein EDO6_03333 [Paenibacillus xylanexedens]
METYKNRVRLLRREIYAMGKKVEQDWEKQILSSEYIISPSSQIPLRKYIDDLGGVRITLEEWNRVKAELRQFFSSRAHFGKRYVTFRGYDYYKLDPIIHLPSEKFDENIAWTELGNRWLQYSPTFSEVMDLMIQDNIDFPSWLAAISYLEWIFNDLCAMRWTGFCIQGHYYGAGKETPVQVERWLERVDIGLNCIAQLLIDLSYRRWREGPYFCTNSSATLNTLLEEKDNPLLEFWDYIGSIIKCVGANGWVRSIREGDQLWIACSMFENKVTPLMLDSETPVHILSNAFGAIHVGYLWTAMFRNMRIQKVTSHVIRTSVHEAEMGRMNGLIEFVKPASLQGIIIHTDDSIFSGKTHKRLLKRLKPYNHNKIYFVPMTLDIGTIYNHPEELTSQGMTINECIDQIESYAREIDGSLPVARSYWAIKKLPRMKCYPTSDPYFKKVVDGSDRLVGMIWERFSKEILNNKQVRLKNDL